VVAIAADRITAWVLGWTGAWVELELETERLLLRVALRAMLRSAEEFWFLWSCSSSQAEAWVGAMRSKGRRSGW
jgi:hypothetical protein